LAPSKQLNRNNSTLKGFNMYYLPATFIPVNLGKKPIITLYTFSP